MEVVIQMINLLQYFTRKSILPLTDIPYHQVMSYLISHCLADYPSHIQEEALTTIQSKSRTRSPQDINLGRGFALIHAKVDKVDHIHLVVGILPKAKKLLKGEKVQSLFCIIIPSSESRIYLSMLARLGRMLRDPEAAKAFKHAGKLLSQGKHDEGSDIIISYVTKFEME